MKGFCYFKSPTFQIPRIKILGVYFNRIHLQTNRFSPRKGLEAGLGGEARPQAPGVGSAASAREPASPAHAGGTAPPRFLHGGKGPARQGLGA